MGAEEEENHTANGRSGSGLRSSRVRESRLVSTVYSSALGVTPTPFGVKCHLSTLNHEGRRVICGKEGFKFPSGVYMTRDVGRD